VAEAEALFLREEEAGDAEAAEAIDILLSDGGVLKPVESLLIEGDWRLVFSSKSSFDITNPLGARVDGSAPGLEAVFRLGSEGLSAPSSSPFQRSIVTNRAFTVVQSIALRGEARVDNTVDFGGAGELLLRARAVAGSQPERRRIDFTFEGGHLRTAKLPLLGVITVPYPVPFKLLGDEAKGYFYVSQHRARLTLVSGWLDTLYLSPAIRISVGNKGTTFVLRYASALVLKQ
jgi:hypothetical protein